VLLAGGRSTRFGRDKLAEPYLGEPVLHRSARALAAVCAEVVVVVAPGAPDPGVPPEVRSRVARDAREGEGPLAGILAGLGEVRTPLALVAAGDMPTLAPPVLGLLLRAVLAGPVDAAALGEAGGFRPLPCALRRETLGVARARFRAGERSVRGFLAALRLAVVPEEAWRPLDPSGETLRDVDLPADLGPRNDTRPP
jgi:molybdopterin-guanine dinucleotide biosynthesis protein A